MYKDSILVDVDVVKIFWKVVDLRGPETTKDGRKEPTTSRSLSEQNEIIKSRARANLGVGNNQTSCSNHTQLESLTSRGNRLTGS